MTTPAHCTRTWRTAGDCPAYDTSTHRCAAPDSYHHVQHVCVCGNVEPPADVAATPDPRLDVVETLLLRQVPSLRRLGVRTAALAQRILDALGDLAAAQTMHEPDAMCLQHFPDRPWLTCHARLGHDGPHMWLPVRPGSPPPPPPPPSGGRTPAPAGLTPAQEIRLRVLEIHKKTSGTANRSDDAAWVEHGDDETPAMEPREVELQSALLNVTDERDDYAARLKAAEERLEKSISSRQKAKARADLAEAAIERLQGALAVALRNHGRGPSDPLDVAISECLEEAPDDTATAGADTTGDE